MAYIEQMFILNLNQDTILTKDLRGFPQPQ